MATYTLDGPLPRATVGKPYLSRFGEISTPLTGGWKLASSNLIGVTISYASEDDAIVGRIAFTPADTTPATVLIYPCDVAGINPTPLVTVAVTVGVDRNTESVSSVEATLYALSTYRPNVALSIPVGKITKPATDGTWAIQNSGNLPAGAAISSAGVLTMTASTTGTYTGTLEASASGYASTRFAPSIIVTAAPATAIDIRWAEMATWATSGTERAITLGTVPIPDTGAAWSWVDRGNLPSAATITTASDGAQSGILTVTFAQAGVYRFKVRVTAPNLPKVERAIAITVVATPPGAVQVATAALPTATVNVEYVHSLGQTFPTDATWALQSRGDLPEAATISSAGVLTATFTVAQLYHTGVARVSANGYTDTDVTVSVTAATTPAPPGKIDVSWAELPSPLVSIAYSQVLGTLIGGPTSAYWRITDRRNLPEGILLGNSSGVLSGTFAAKGVYTFEIQVYAQDFADLNHEVRLVVVTEAEAHPPPPPPIYGTTESQDGTEWLVTHLATDDGSGRLLPTQDGTGTVNYITGELYFPPEEYFPSKTWSSSKTNGTGEWKSVSTRDTFGESAEVEITYQEAEYAPTNASETFPPAVITLQLTPYTTDAVVPNSVRFTIGSTIYQDNEGLIIMAPDANSVGTEAGTVDYSTGTVVLHTWTAGGKTLTMQSLAVQRGLFTETEFQFRTAMAPLRPTAFQVAVTAVDGELLAGSADVNGDITGDAMTGTVDAEFGVVNLRFGEMTDVDDLTEEDLAAEWYDEDDIVNGEIWKPRKIIPSTARYNAVAYSSLPLSADLLGLDPVRLPSDGRVPCIIRGDMVIVQHHTTHSVPSPVAGGTLDTELTGVARARVYDAEGDAIPPSRYSLAQDTGILTWATPLDLSGYTSPYSVEATIEDAALVTDADISGQLRLNRALGHDYPIGALVASSYVYGDLYAQWSTPFSQQAWTSVWSSERIGSPILAQYNSLLHPLELTNAASWRERWLLLFTSQTSFRVIGETLGDITDALGGSGYHDTNHDLAPINPLTSTPYFILRWQGWGSGWVAGNCLRFDQLLPANFPLWVAMTVHPSAPTTGQDRFRLLLRGGVDT
jgi:hypothetical protein